VVVTSLAKRAGGLDPPGERAPSVVPRPALFALLSAAAAGGVTLVSAPAGSGKTLLLQSWIEHAGLAGRVAWVSVDRGERDAQRFWMSLVDKLRAIEGLEAVVQKCVASPDFEPAAAVERLAAQLSSLAAPVVLVVDDLHELQSPDALSQLQVLVGRRPASLSVVLAARHDPQLGLHRLRLAGQLTEIRESDLRFTLDETRELLVASGIVLSQQSASQLHERTEGWAAGLRLAAISLIRHPEPERFVAEFAGSERTVADYLLAEVLERQPDEVRRLLLRTSILERVNGALADALVGSSGSERILQALEAANAFVVSLDPERSWFRYHHLFADLLRLELRRSEPEAVLTLHGLAAEWYAAHGYVTDAVRHAQAARDWSHAAHLLVDFSLTLWHQGEGGTLAALIDAFPRDAPPTPELALLFSYREMMLGSLDGAAACLALAERRAAQVPEDRQRRFEVVLAVTRLSLARRRSDFGTVLDKVQPLLGPADAETLTDVGLSQEARAAALMNLGIVELWAYRLDEAARHLEQGLELARRIDLAYVEVGCLSHLAALDAWQSFGLVRQRCAQAIERAEAHGMATQPILCVALAMMGLVDVAQARFQVGQVWLDRAKATLRPDLEPATALLVQRAQGMLALGQGQLEEALVAFRAAERLQSMLVTPHALTAQMREFLILTLLRLGRRTEARRVLDGLSEAERHWGEARTAMASVRLAEGQAQAAADAIGPVVDGEAPVLHSGSLVEALIVRAIARDRLGDTRGAESDIERALEVAEPDTQLFPFVLIRPTDLLQRHPRQRTAHAALLADILDAFAGAPLRPRLSEPARPREDLSDTELRVLGYLPSQLSAPEIAAELCVSTSTVKTHMRQIYAKLDVHKRTEAVERARGLGLLGPSSRAQR
jgi:LuxR family transcriptional regulator, maltose regulon positive regulatory protein